VEGLAQADVLQLLQKSLRCYSSVTVVLQVVLNVTVVL
jgi:hypothetical protein